MTQRLGRLFAVFTVCAMLWHSVGCSTPDRTKDTLTVLERGKARGHLVLTTDGAIEAGQTLSFFLGPRGTQVSFDGNIDFGSVTTEALRRREENGETSKRPNGEASAREADGDP